MKKNKKSKKVLVVFLVFVAFISFSFQSKYFEVAKQIEIYNTLFKELNMYYVDEINPAELTDKAIKNTLKDLDPYTNFYNEQDVEDARIRREGEYGGIGVSVFYLDEGIQIGKIFKGYSADKAKLKVGDIITAINGESLSNMDKEAMSLFLKGVPNSSFKATVKRQNKPFAEMINDSIGYITLTRFNEKASSEVKKAFKKLKKEGMKKLVFDLRSNPGGSLMEAINISNFFLPKGKTIVTTKAKIKKWSNIYRGTKDPLDLEMPIVVLINGRSASASEIVSGALQDYDRAVVLGERSFGKGLVQRYRELTYGTQMKLTISKYYTPSGRCIQELDYTNRDKDGNVPKFSDNGINEFKTEKGRIVYDGGGVLPDVISNSNEKTEFTKNLLESKAIFNYVTDFYYKNPEISPVSEFTFSNDDFKDFTNFLKTDTTFVTEQEKLFAKAYKISKNSNIDKEFQKIKTTLFKEKIVSISKNKKRVIETIKLAILDRYYYQEGIYKHNLTNDFEIDKAVTLLNNKKEYNEILSIK
jgi:carboxyl-terminal processing protease